MRNVSELRPGDTVWVVYPGVDPREVHDFESAQFLAYDRYGISVTAHNNEHFVSWVGRPFVADPRTGAAFVLTEPEKLPVSIPELE